MNRYPLTRSEAYSLCVLLHLPVQVDSILSKFLSSGSLDGQNVLLEESLQSLQKKGIYNPLEPQSPFPTEFITSLTLASVNAAELSVIHHIKEETGLLRFGQVGASLVEFSIDSQQLILYPARTTANAAPALIPVQPSIQRNEGLSTDFTLISFLLFKEACLQADLAYVRSEFASEVFAKERLFAGFASGTRWMNLFAGFGMKETKAPTSTELEESLSRLYGQGYLENLPDQQIRIGAAGQPLADVFSDPDLQTLTVALQAPQPVQTTSGSFLIGAERLFLVEFQAETISLQQLGDLSAGYAWIKGVLERGAQVHYAEYSLPVVSSAEVHSAVARPAPQPAPSATPTKAPAIWYYMANKQRCGPVPAQNMQYWLAHHQLNPETLVWRSPMKGWVAARLVKELWVAPTSPRTCAHCGATLPANVRFCEQCGTPAPPEK